MSPAAHPLDLAVIVAYFAGMILAGVWVSRRVRGFGEFLVAKGMLSTPLLVGTLVSTYYELDVLFGNSGDAAREGIVVFVIYGRPFMLTLLVATFFVARRLQATPFVTLPDILQHHYGPAARVASAIGSFFYSLPIIAVLGMAAVAHLVLGVPLWLGALLGCAATLAYTAVGGFMADVVTDVVQFGIMFVSLAIALPFMLAHAGGFDGIRETLGPGFFAPLGEGLPAAYVVAWALTALSVLVDPALYQRIFAARDWRTIRNALLLGIVLWTAFDWAVVAAGMAGRAIIQRGGIASVGLDASTDPDQILLRSAMAFLPAGLSGLFLAGCLAAAMSTIDSYTLIAAGNVVHDIYCPLARRPPTDRQLVRYTRVTMFLSLGLALALAFTFSRIKLITSFIMTTLTSTALLPVLAALWAPKRVKPLAGTLSSWAGLVACALFYPLVLFFGEYDESHVTVILPVGGARVMLEYGIFLALPAAIVAFAVGQAFGRRP